MAKKTKKQKAAAKAARTRAANKNKKKGSNKVNPITKQWRKITSATGTIAGLAQITGPDMAASTGQPVAIRAKNFINSLLGRTTGYSPFKDTPGAGGTIPQTISIDGMFNKYTGIGAGMTLYSYVAKMTKFLPHGPKAKQLGKALIGGGIIGGAFSESGNPHTHNLIPNTHTSYSSGQQMVVT